MVYLEETKLKFLTIQRKAHPGKKVISFLDALRSQRASLVIGFDLHPRVISKFFKSLRIPNGAWDYFGYLEIPWDP